MSLRVFSIGLFFAVLELAPSLRAAPNQVPPDITTSAPAPGSSADRDKVLGPGDVVTLEIVEDKEAPVSKRVTDTGDLDVPYIGRVAVNGKSCSDAASEIKRKLEAEYYFHATVNLGIDQVNPRSYTAGRIFLSGAIKAPGPQEMQPGEKLTVSTAILKAGGFGQFADDRKVKVTRKLKTGAQTYTVDVKAVLQGGKLDQDFDLRDGDYVNIPQKLINW